MDYIALGCRVRSARRQMNLTQAQLAEKIDVSTSFIGHIERGTRALRLETFFDLCVALQASPAALLGISHPAFPDLFALTPVQHEQLAQLLRYACGVVQSAAESK